MSRPTTDAARGDRPPAPALAAATLCAVGFACLALRPTSTAARLCYSIDTFTPIYEP